MHGRLKVKTTAEQEAAKKKEREKKLKLFKVGIQKIFDKRKNEEFDNEALKLTKDFLQQNPDIYTLWNYRKEILLNLRLKVSEKEVELLGAEELELVKNCLQKNPKSYGAWHHRFWAMEYIPNADWQTELKLCNYFLSLDERNFHCWDYRRLVLSKCCVDLKEELTFTTDLIEKNFSNYSAWHYRSILLPDVYPGSAYRSIDEEILLKEYDLVQNAAFTDPNDQSVWFYHQWLLGKGEKSLDVIRVAFLKQQEILVVVLSKPVKISKSFQLGLKVNGIFCDVAWKPVGPLSSSTVWCCKHSPDIFALSESIDVTIEIISDKFSKEFFCTLNEDKNYIQKLSNPHEIFCSEISAATKDVLLKELESCEQLCELESDNKWTLYTSATLMRSIDSCKYQSKISEYMKQLNEVDYLRSNYYDDIRSKFVIENIIENLSDDSKDLSFKNKNLSSLYHFDHLISVEKVDLSNNNLSSVLPVCYLLSIQYLILDENNLQDCSDLENLQCLKHLSIKNNYINSVKSVEKLQSCPKLQCLFLDGNPVTNNPNFKENIRNILGSIFLDGIQL